MLGLGVIACLVFLYGLVSRRLEGTSTTAPMVFVSAAPLTRGFGRAGAGEGDERKAVPA